LYYLLTPYSSLKSLLGALRLIHADTSLTPS
jgi:hypothetical protein